MFEYFKDVAQELSGIDTDAAKKLKIEKAEEEKKNRFIFSKSMKTMVIVFGGLYLLLAISTIAAIKDLNKPFTDCISYLILGLLDIVALFSLIFGKKKGEIIALISAFLFVCGLFVSIVLS